MNKFTIKDIENLSAIKAHTWRIWEQRYNIAIPQRKESNHRFYDNENLKQILRISYLYHSGIKISKIAKLDCEEMKQMALRKLSKEEVNEFYIKEMIEASLDFDEERFEENFLDALDRMGIEETILKVFYPYQDRIGMLWLTDHVIPAQEHFTSNIIRQKIIAAIDGLPPVATNKNRQIALYTPKEEQHEIPLLFIHYLLKKNGNKVIYFGRNVSLQAIKGFGENGEFTHLHFHLVTNLTNKNANEYVKQVATQYPDTKIIMSGSQVQYVTEVPENVSLLHSMKEILSFAKEGTAAVAVAH
ncbi:MAG: MerR family transcriptional regulator [Segetibacter sp.]